MRSIIQFMDSSRFTPSLLPIFRSQQQAELLALLLGDPDLELSLTDLSQRLAIPYPSVHREIERAQSCGLVTSRKIGNTRLVTADPTGPYFDGLADVLVRAFGVPAVLGSALGPVDGVTEAFVYGSWAARYRGGIGARPVEDIDVLVLGDPDRRELFERIEPLAERLGRPVQITIREAAWLGTGSGSFHQSVTSRPMVEIPIEAYSSD